MEGCAGSEGSDGTLTGTTDVGAGESSTGSDSCEYAAAMSDPLIEDFESGTGNLPNREGRNGVWFTADDGTGTQSISYAYPAGGDRTGNAARTVVSNFTGWGALFGVTLFGSDADICPYDVSHFDGIEFWSRGSGLWRFQVGTSATVPVVRGGQCETTCDDHLGYSFEPATEWELHRIPWSELMQSGWGTPATFDAAQVLQIQFINQQQQEGPFELVVDDIQLYLASSR